MSDPNNPALEAKEVSHPSHSAGRVSADGTIHDDSHSNAKGGHKEGYGEQMMSEHERAALAEVGVSAEYAPGSPERKRIERKLKLKLDARFSILVSQPD